MKGVSKSSNSKETLREDAGWNRETDGVWHEKPEVLSISFAPAFTHKNGCQVSQATETRWKVWSKKDTAFGGGGSDQWALKLHPPKSMVPDGMYAQVLRQLANIFVKTLLFILGRSQQSEEEITCHSYFQEKKEDLECREGDGATNPGKIYWQEGEEGNWNSSALMFKKEVI